MKRRRITKTINYGDGHTECEGQFDTWEMAKQVVMEHLLGEKHCYESCDETETLAETGIWFFELGKTGWSVQTQQLLPPQLPPPS